METGTLSGAVVRVERVIWINNHLKEDRENAKKFGFQWDGQDILVPEGQRTGGVPAPIYDAFSTGSERACADIVVTTRLLNGTPAVLAIKRNVNKPFGGIWWMQGGSYHTYRSMSDFVSERVERECGIRPELQGVIGQFRTCAEDYVCSTTNTCYVGYAPYEEIMEARVDKDHGSWCLYRLDYFKLVPAPTTEWHWYPLFVFKKALITMPE